MRYGIFGGSFDPVHCGHLALAAAAVPSLLLDEVIFVPAFSPPHKPLRQLAPVADRLAMLERALRGRANFRLSRIEVETAAPAYTLDTVLALQRAAGSSAQFVLLLGWDAWLDLPQWHESATLRTLVEIAVAPRPGVGDASGTHDVALGAFPNVRRIPCEPVAISSSAIRARVARGEDIRQMVPETVRTYIETHGLYAHD